MKKITLLIVLLLKYSFIISQVGYEQNVVIDGTFGVGAPNETAVADLDGDGFQDIIVAGGKVAWFKNINGTGSFSKSKDIASGDYAYTNVSAGDIDGDGDIDVVFCFRGSNAQIFSLCINQDGQGNFGSPILLTTGGGFNNSYKIQIIDIDADNDNDLFMSDGSFVSWFENTNGLGVFTERILIGSHSNTTTVIKAFFAKNVDNEPRAEVMGVVNGYLRCYRINANYTITMIDSVTGSPFTDTINAADIDNDGDVDIITSYDNGPTKILQCFKNSNGLGSFGFAQDMVSMPSNMSTTADGNNEKRAFAIVDFDHDDKLDIVHIDSNIANANWYKNMGNGVFTMQQLIRTTDKNLRDVKVIDVNNDGHYDILMSSRFDNKVSWYKNINGTGNFGTENIVYDTGGGGDKVDYGDIDGDGDLDLVSSFGNNLAWYQNVDGIGSFSGRQKNITEDFTNASNATIGDIDKDGDLDVMAFSWYQNSGDFSTIAWYENSNGNGTFTRQRIVVSNSELILKINLVDVDRDNDLDIICGSANNKISLYKNNGNGTFAPQNIFSTITNNKHLLDMVSADFDNDNDIDVAICYNNDEIAWYENVNGQGGFTVKHVIQASMHYPISIFASDLDGDNDKDLVFCNRFQNQIGYFKNSGSGNFSAQTLLQIPGLLHPSVSFTHDVDNDGDQDLFYDNETDFKLKCMLNDGSGNLSTPFDVHTIVYDNYIYRNIPSIKSVDVNADGKLDLVLSERSYNSKIAWFKNLGEFKNKITGNVKVDADNNGCNSNDFNVPNALVTTQTGQAVFSTFSNADGNYELFAGQGQFVTSMISPYQNYIVNPATHTSNFASNNTVEINKFCLQPTQLFDDLGVVVYPLTDARTGFNSKYKIVIKNYGTNVVNANMAFNYNNLKFNYLSSSVILNSQTANTLNYLISNLLPFQTKEIEITFQVKTIPNVTIGELIQFSSSLNGIQSDVNLEDNQFTLEQAIVGAYDPNDVQVLEGDKILIDDADEYLHYIIRFQNTGNSYAQRVRVTNVLSDKLDWDSIQLESYSHNNKVEIVDGSTVNFIFDAIYLPSSMVDYNKSQGYISYKIKPKGNVVVGDVISNNANIYFDYNPAINTNTVHTEIVNVLAVDDQEYLENSIQVYPNPTNGLVKLDSKFEIKSVEIYNILGKLVSVKADLKNFPNGIYIMKINTEKGVSVKKIIKN